MDRHAGDLSVDQIIYREPVPADTLNLLGLSGVGPVAGSLDVRKLPLKLLDLLAFSVTPDPACPEGNLFFKPFPQAGRAILVHRDRTWARTRDSTFSHVLIGSAEVLTVRRVLGLWDWTWDGAAHPDEPFHEVLGPVDLSAPGVPQPEPIRLDRSGESLGIELARLIISLVCHPRRKHVVVADLRQRRDLLYGLIDYLDDSVLASGFSGHEDVYDNAQQRLPPLVFSQLARRGPAEAGDRLVLDLTEPADEPAEDIVCAASCFIRLWRDNPRTRDGGVEALTTRDAKKTLSIEELDWLVGSWLKLGTPVRTTPQPNPSPKPPTPPPPTPQKPKRDMYAALEVLFGPDQRTDEEQQRALHHILETPPPATHDDRVRKSLMSCGTLDYGRLDRLAEPDTARQLADRIARHAFTRRAQFDDDITAIIAVLNNRTLPLELRRQVLRTTSPSEKLLAEVKKHIEPEERPALWPEIVPRRQGPRRCDRKPRSTTLGSAIQQVAIACGALLLLALLIDLGAKR
jgi:hypothetical protein